MKRTVIVVLMASVVCLAGSAIQATLEDFRTHPWRMPAGNVAATKAETTAAPVPETAAPTPATPQAKSVATAAAKGQWEVQLGSLSSPDAAKKRGEELESVIGSGVRIVPQDGTWKLRWGNYPDKKSAIKARDDLKKKGVDGFPVEL